jgi:hypothetical protein
MAVFYVGPRKVLKGRNTNNMVNPYKGTAGTYSFYPLFSTDHVLDGAPNTNYTPGSGEFPHGLNLSRVFTGLDNAIQPLKSAGGGARIDGMRFRPFENRSTAGAEVFDNSFGHEIRETEYSYNRRYEHIYKFERMDDPGHALRYTDAAGTADSFGAFGPTLRKGVGDGAFAADFGQIVPAGYDNEYGRNRVNEWRGVASAKALDV